MASWIEIDRIRKAPSRFKSIAASLLIDPEFSRKDAIDFLENIANWKGAELSNRQTEFLLDLRDGAERHFKIRDLSVAILIQKCFESSWALNEARDEERIQALHAAGRTFVTGFEIGWFKRICKELNEMEQYM